MDTSHPTDPAAQQQTLDIARARQEHKMRWVLLGTIVTTVLLSNTATLLYGPPALPLAAVQGSWATLLAWLVKQLFGRMSESGDV